MLPDSRGGVGQSLYTGSNQVMHQRDSSLSSLACSASILNPYVAGTTVLGPTDTSTAMSTAPDDREGGGDQYAQLAKSMSSYPDYHSLEQALPEMAYPVAIPGPPEKLRMGRGMMVSAPEFSGSSAKSQPTSVASSVASDSPATPPDGDNASERRRKGYSSNAPKLDRTMTDVYGDELYSPNFAITSTPPSQAQFVTSPISNDVFNQRLNAANHQHLSASRSPTTGRSRDKSPFRTDSPLAADSSNCLPTPVTQHVGGKFRQRPDLQPLDPQSRQTTEPDTPKTISPKDAFLEFNDNDQDAALSLFSSIPSGRIEFDFGKAMLPHHVTDLAQQVLPSSGGGTQPNPPDLIPTQLPIDMQMQSDSSSLHGNRMSNITPPRLSPAGSNSSASVMEFHASSHQRPAGRRADGGTYTCTYHGCTLRFETPVQLQKHKREGHRQAQGLGVPRDTAIPTMFNTQAGPHRCDRINPSTGKPCNTIFSRPYDLTRHEDTIHNARKQKVRCDICAEEKTFSRADALTRHYRVCHPEAEVPAKHRRRGAT